MDCIREICNNKLSSFFVFLSFVIATVCLSFGVSVFKNYYDYFKDKEIFSKNTCIVNVKFKKNVELQNLFEELPKVKESVKLVSGDFMYEIENRRIYVNGIYTTKQFSEGDYPLKEGRYLYKEETASNKKVAMIGFLLKDNCKKLNGEYFIKVEGEEYKVVGFIGREAMSYWNNSIIVPINSLPKKYLLQQASTIPLVFFNNNSNAYLNNLNLRINSSLNSIKVNSVSNEVSLKKIISIQKSFYTSIGILIVIGVINILNFSNYWVESLKKSMAIQRVLGASSFNILIYVFEQIAVIAVFALGASFIIHIGLENILNKVFMLKMEFKLTNLFISFIFSILLCLLSSVCLLKKVLKFDREIKNYI